MADDIGGMGEDPRDVARRRLNMGRRAREAEAARRAAGQASGSSMTPPTQAMVPYRENLPASSGGRGGPLAPSGSREMAAPRGDNLPAVRREGMPSIRVPPGAADMLRGAMQSPMARAAGTGRAAAGRAAAEGAMRLGDRLMRGGRSPAARTPADGLGEGPAEPMRTMTPNYEEDMYAGSVAGRPAPAPAPAPRPRQAARPRYSEADIARIRSIMEGGDIQPEQPGFFERMGIRRTNETGEGAPSTGSLRGDLQALGRSLGFKKGGMVKAKAPAKKMKSGGAVKAPAKKMAHGGKVAPKKMMKGGMTSKPKKMMGGGRAMYAKGGMAKGCK